MFIWKILFLFELVLKKRMMLILVNNLFVKRNLDKNRGSLIVNYLRFYKKRLIYWANVFNLMNVSLIHRRTVL